MADDNPVNMPLKKQTPLKLQMIPAKSPFRLNDSLTFQLNVSENAYVNCFYQNYQGLIWQIFPNQFQASDYLIAHQTVSIPQQNKAFEIALDMANVTEQIMCVAAREKLVSDFLSGQVSPQGTLPLSSLPQLLEHYRQKNSTSISQQVLAIKVKN